MNRRPRYPTKSREDAMKRIEVTAVTQQTPPTSDANLISTIQEIVFGTRIARSITIEDPETIPGITAERIWNNLRAYLTVGDWPDRRRTAAEIDAELAEADEAPTADRGDTASGRAPLPPTGGAR